MASIQMRPYHVAIAAEAAAATLFARCGCDVLVQYGADQPEYDLAISRNGKLLKVSVKGSQDGSWGLTQSFLSEAKYHVAIDAWLARHGAKTLFCFVQFKDTTLNEMPRIYLAWPRDIAVRLKETASGRGDTILYEHKVWSRKAFGAGTVDEIPSNWRFSSERLTDILAEV